MSVQICTPDPEIDSGAPSPYVVTIFGDHRIPLCVETLECTTDDDALQRGRERAIVREAFGYEIWTKGHKLASVFSRELLRGTPLPPARPV